MPVYTYKCTEDHETITTCSIKDRQDKVECSTCGVEAKFVISKIGLIAGKTKPFKSERREMKERLSEREDRLKEMSITEEGKAQADKFRHLSKRITGGKF